jgi:hypothetical protein
MKRSKDTLTQVFSAEHIDRLRQKGCGLINCRSRLEKWNLFAKETEKKDLQTPE